KLEERNMNGGGGGSGSGGGGSGSVKTPTDFLKLIRGRPVVVKLNSGVDYRGRPSSPTLGPMEGLELYRGMIRAVGELDCSSAHICLRELGKSEDKAKKGCRCEATDSSAMGLAAPWYRRGGTSVESSIPCGRALVVKGAEEVENAKANSKYQDKAEGQRQGTS
ncbi:hypothetical protein BHE74_00020391, partial [Ensete ventricosum]